MSTIQKKYPRATVRKILKAHSQKSSSRSVDSLVYLDFVEFLQKYGKEVNHLHNDALVMLTNC